jgi:hypothetical protein
MPGRNATSGCCPGPLNQRRGHPHDQAEADKPGRRRQDFQGASENGAPDPPRVDVAALRTARAEGRQKLEANSAMRLGHICKHRSQTARVPVSAMNHDKCRRGNNECEKERHLPRIKGDPRAPRAVLRLIDSGPEDGS